VQVTKPRTQRRRLFQAPAHIRRKQFSAPLSPELKKKHGANAVPVRVGDTVRIMRGDRKGVEGKVNRIDSARYRIVVEGVTRTKVDGSTIPISIHPSKAMITNLDLNDKWRRKTLERKGVMPVEKEVRPPEERPSKSAVREVEEKPKKKERARKPRKKKEDTEAASEKKAKGKKAIRAGAKPRRRRTKKAEVEAGEK
jgi:large subunit ribosomal protein L24